MPRARRLSILVVVLLLSICVVALALRGTFDAPRTPHPNGVPHSNGVNPFPQGSDAETPEQRALLVAKGKALAETAPPMGTPEWTAWRQKLSPAEFFAWAVYMDSKTVPPPPTAAQAAGVQVAPLANAPFPGWVLTNYKPLLRIDPRISVAPLMVDTKCTPSGWVSTFWARRAQDAFAVDWSAGRVTKAVVDTARTAEGPAREHLAPYHLLTGNRGKLILTLGEVWHKIPWPRESTVYPLAVDPRSRYAFGDTQDNEGNCSLVIVDTREKTITSILPVPKAPSGMNCILNTDGGYFYVFDYEWQWIMLFDLRKANE